MAALSLEDLTCGHRRTLSLQGLQVDSQTRHGFENGPMLTETICAALEVVTSRSFLK